MPEAPLNLSNPRRVMRLASLLLLLLLGVNAMAQRDISERRITVSLSNVTVERALSSIADRGDFRFSYNTELIPVDSIVNVQATNQTVAQLMETLFAGRIAFKVVGKHVILKPARKPKADPGPAMFTLKGTITNARTGKPLGNASVFAMNRKYATLTQGDGAYELELEGDQKSLGVSVRMRNFLDTVVVIRPGDQTLNVQLLPVPEDIARMPMREAALHLRWWAST